MDAIKALERLDAFYEDMRGLLTETALRELDDKSLDGVLDTLRKEGAWGAKNDATMARLVNGGRSRSGAFYLLTEGNERVRNLLVSTLATTAGATKPRRGRPPKKKETDE